MPPRDHEHASARRLFLAGPPRNSEDGSARLHPEDAEHALRVLRLGVGHAVVGLDGAGHAWNAVVASITRRDVFLGELSLCASEPPPDDPASEALHVSIYVSWPKSGPAEEMLDRLTQLGAARVVPLVAERSAPHARELSAGRRERLERIAREALKQSGRLWMPEIGAPLAVADVPRHDGERSALLSPRASHSFLAWATGVRSAGIRRVSLFVGPEGGWTEQEESELTARGAVSCRLARSVLRIETAAEAALSVLAALDLPA